MPASRMSSCWPAAASATPAISARSRAPGRPAPWSPPPCTAASSQRTSCVSSAERALEVLDQRGGHVDPGRLLDPVPAGDAVDLEHIVAPVSGAQEVDAGVVG